VERGGGKKKAESRENERREAIRQEGKKERKEVWEVKRILRRVQES
jgi:hypothetical protein